MRQSGVAPRMRAIGWIFAAAAAVFSYTADAQVTYPARPVRPGLPQIAEKERQALRLDLERTGLLAHVPTAKAA